MRAMKDSGLPWSTTIPEEWTVKWGKRVLTLMQREVRPDDEVVTCFRDGEVILRKLRRTEGFTMSDKEIGYQGINVGDIVIHGMDGFAGAMGISKSKGKGTPVYVVCTPQDGNFSPYIIYYLRCLAHNDVFLALSTGIRERSCDLKWNKISKLPFICPPLSEQQRIATYLDTKCGEIDELIGIQEKFIEELKAYKQSVITEAVTKGLNPNATLKDSGVEWIGEIPEEWEVCRLKNIFNLKTGTTPKEYDSKSESDNYINWYTPSDIDDTRYILYDAQRKLSKEIIDKENINIYPEGSILFVGIGATAGKVGYIVSAGYSNQQITALIPQKGYSKFYFYLLFVTKDLIRDNAFFTTLPIINNGYLSQVLTVFPPLSEQHLIATYLDNKCSQIDSLIALKQSKIEELKSFKKSLIYEYVTGKKTVPQSV